jgi:hypothetical protein
MVQIAGEIVIRGPVEVVFDTLADGLPDWPDDQYPCDGDVGNLHFEEVPEGTCAHYAWEMRARGVARLFEPARRVFGARLERAVWECLRRFLEAEETISTGETSILHRSQGSNSHDQLGMPRRAA